MTRLGLALVAALAVACSSGPTAPSAPLGGTAVAIQDARPDHTPGTVKVTIYFYSDDIGGGGSSHVEGMPVTLASVPAGALVSGFTGKQGSISIDVPKASTAVNWTVPPNSLGWCAGSGTLDLPYEVRDNWFMAHYDPRPAPTGCIVQ